MRYKQQIRQVTSWIDVLTSTNIPIKSAAVLINNSPLKKLFAYQLNHCNIKTYKLIKEVPPKILINEIINSDCNIIIADKSSYILLRQIMPYLRRNVVIVLTQEYWVPDWAWAFTQYYFLCQQDLP
ncbi:hypothetical protein [Photobacterium kishitanii]|uniref:Uncharacterized protein n=1 Tax=Photobacterium kishitanii TaxID=318456 RepID=A0A2T3KBF8_9GAMM|nr:hypothetical protein [Photobacterium kishitanii]PSU91245.1 hypothetical protein C9J27_23180 [Photobacterium kishitanii]PSU96586.1 hypothetical protein C0W35_04045 [Photobacterium kishitanii]PSV16372.1 hypothetical protein C0W28_13945 [Photobacterium kishitanii]